MARQDDLPTTGYLQPAALTGTISGFGGAAASLVGDIRSGAITLDVPDVDEWLCRFNQLIDVVDGHRMDLIVEAHSTMTLNGLGHFELSQQIAHKIADRTGSAEGGLAWALDEVVSELRKIHQALSDAKATLVSTDDAIADNMNRIAPPDTEIPHGG